MATDAAAVGPPTTLAALYDLGDVLDALDDMTTPEQQRGAYEALLRALRPASAWSSSAAKTAAADNPMDITTTTEAEAASEAEADGEAASAQPSQPEQEPPQFLEPRVLGMACELLGRHAATVPALSTEALTALVAVLTEPARFAPEDDEAGSRAVRAKAAAALAAIAAGAAGAALGPDARTRVLDEGLAPLLAAEPEGAVRRALGKAQAALVGATAAEAEAEAEAFRAAVLGADKMTQTELAAAAAAAAAATAAGALEDGGKMEVVAAGDGDGEEAVLALVKEGAERLEDEEAAAAVAVGGNAGASPARARGRSPSRSRSRSRSYSRSRGRSYSRSHSRSYSRSPSYSRGRSLSRSYSRGRSYSRSRSRSYSRSRSRSLSRDSYYSDAGGDQERENRPPRGSEGGGGGGRRQSAASAQGQQGGKPGGREGGKKGGRGKGREDGEATVAALKEVLATLKGINEAMPDHQGFLPEELAARVGCPDPALWQEVYTEARIRPNKSNRLYRSRILYLIAYLERRLGLPLSRPPFPAGGSRRGGDRDGSRGGRYGDRGDRDGGRGDRGRYGDRDGGRGHYGRGGEAGGRGERDRGDRGGDRYGASARWEEGGGRGGERDGERGGEQQRHERENEVVEEQMESVEATPFLAIHHLPSDVKPTDVLRLVQEQSPHYKIAPWDIAVLRGLSTGAVAYVTLGNTKVAGAILDGLQGRPFFDHRRKMRVGYTLGAPSRHVYVGGVRGLEDQAIEDALWEYGPVQRLETAQGPRRDTTLDYVFATFESAAAAGKAVRDINRKGGRVRGGHTLRVTFRPFKGDRKSTGGGGGHGGDYRPRYGGGGRGGEEGGYGGHHGGHGGHQGGYHHHKKPRYSEGDAGGGRRVVTYTVTNGGGQGQGRQRERANRGRSRSPAPSRGRGGEGGARRYSRSVSVDRRGRGGRQQQQRDAPSPARSTHSSYSDGGYASDGGAGGALQRYGSGGGGFGKHGGGRGGFNKHGGGRSGHKRPRPAGMDYAGAVEDEGVVAGGAVKQQRR